MMPCGSVYEILVAHHMQQQYRDTLALHRLRQPHAYAGLDSMTQVFSVISSCFVDESVGRCAPGHDSLILRSHA